MTGLTMTTERDKMIAAAIRTGMSRADASLLTDLGKHAFEQAFDAMRRVVETAPQPLKLPLTASVMASFASIMRESFPEHWAAFVATETDRENGTVIVLPDRRAHS